MSSKKLFYTPFKGHIQFFDRNRLSIFRTWILRLFPNLISNIFLIAILLIFVWNSFYSRDDFVKKNSVFDGVEQTLSVQIVQKIYTSTNSFVFSEKYLALAGGKLIDIDNPISQKNLKDGYKYSLVGTFKPYNWDDSFERYKITSGIVGVFKNKKIVDSQCDIWCQGLSGINFWRLSIKNYYKQEICQSNTGLISFLGLKSCQDIYALSVGLTLGGTDEFDKISKENFKNLGLSHLVAVSGFQVVLLFTFVENTLNKIKIRRSFRIGIIILFLGLMILLVGPQPPVLRSSFSILTSSFVLIIFGIKISSFRSLVYSSIWMLTLNPLFLFSISFQLSFLASFGLILGFQKK